MRLVLIGFITFLLAACQTTTNVETESVVKEETIKSKPVAKPEPIEEDLWVRIVEQFTMEIPDDPSVDYYRDWYLKHPQHLKAISERAKPFLYYIVKRLEEEDMPMELALLPAVESAFDPHAYSYSSAAGLWQFIPSTGDHLGLKRSYWYDGRRDVVASTNAALKYLAYLNRFFDGNWAHAIAAYNSGEGRVQRAIRKNIREGKPTDFFSLDLPKETRGYLPKLLAMADVILNQEKYGLDIPDIPNQHVLMRVDPNKQLSLDSVSKYTGVSIDDLKRYNAGLNRAATPPDGPYHLLIPIDKEQLFLTGVANDTSPQVQLASHTVKAGDTLGAIARKYNSSTAEIMRTNKLTSTNIRIGQTLIVPEQFASTTSQTKSTQSSRSTNNSANSTNSAKRSDTKANSRTMYYQVRRGDTLGQIAQKYKITVNDIMSWNNLSDSAINIGQKLKLLVNLVP